MLRSYPFAGTVAAALVVELSQLLVICVAVGLLLLRGPGASIYHQDSDFE